MLAALEAGPDPLEVAEQTGIGAYRMGELIDGAEATVSEVLVIGMTLGVRPSEWFREQQGAAL
ncbi:hypothetical protein [Nocardia brevicatena]|uniref:hypothetical protein n=1 Tax=Nocardia brevicatena TaxID=37327 RepID=UPI00059294B5|nr:hypothetical protein [Nocardia brevicatena]